MFIMFYTLFASLPLLVGVLYISRVIFSHRMGLFTGLHVGTSEWVALIIRGAFLVKLPIYGSHL